MRRCACVRTDADARRLPKGKAATPPQRQGVYLELFPQNVVAFPEALPPIHDGLAAWP
jgi:hypothetical protein